MSFDDLWWISGLCFRVKRHGWFPCLPSLLPIDTPSGSLSVDSKIVVSFVGFEDFESSVQCLMGRRASLDLDFRCWCFRVSHQ